jgi:hypothetical protein
MVHTYDSLSKYLLYPGVVPIDNAQLILICHHAELLVCRRRSFERPETLQWLVDQNMFARARYSNVEC